MKIEHISEYVGQNGECFKITCATEKDFEIIGQEFTVLDAWAVDNSKVSLSRQIGEFDFYLILDSQNSMLFKLAYLHDK
tara:strand:- start:2896 stop:3132 length:237 start_codon:yes stop_codon:yes gene_type:complete